VSMRLVIECLRANALESEHDISAVAMADGDIALEVGDDFASFWRSAAKPFQLEVSLQQLSPSVVEALTDDELALGAASHSGQPRHVEGVEKLLRRFALTAEVLQCGAHLPVHEPSARALTEALVLHNNCSGKHTFMAAACQARGWPMDYRPLEHPLQQLNQQRLNEVTQHTHNTAIDGCSVPTFHAPVSAQARAWSKLAVSMADVPSSLLGRIGWAMHRAPFMMSGDGRLDLAVVQQASEPLTVKVGAEGLFCIASPARRLGIAVKVHSGNTDVLAVAVRAVLERLDMRVSGAWPWADVLNVRGLLVGSRRARWLA
jgi:L-asparaginase II